MQRFVISAGIAFLALAGCATAPDSDGSLLAEPTLARFEPQPSSAQTVDYEYVDEFLGAYVLDFGPSLRVRMPRPNPPTGTRLYYGHTSPYRLEGNKIRFSEFLPTTVDVVEDYVDSLVEIGNDLDVTTLPKNEQLAYWFNLHNLLVIREIARTYPVPYPARIEPNGDGVPLNEAKLVEILGVPLSLNDIRQGIVYRHWSDPRVIYGFFHGDLAGPSIRQDAYTADNVARSLDDNAKEFINSLRGVSDVFGPVEVSPIYAEAQAALFPEWPDDFRDHLLQFANEEVAAIVRSAESFNFAGRETRIADLMGGQMGPINAPINLAGNSRNVTQKDQLAQEFLQKQRTLYFRMREKSGARVILDDQPTSSREEVLD